MTVIKVRPRHVVLDALHVVPGKTTKREIVEFCGADRANVGAPSSAEDELGMDSTDIRWAHVDNGTDDEGEDFWVRLDGDWILRGVTGKLFRCGEEHFVKTYEDIT